MPVLRQVFVLESGAVSEMNLAMDTASTISRMTGFSYGAYCDYRGDR
jgi:hypothetical protein